MFIFQLFPCSPAHLTAEQRRDLLLIAFVDSNGWVEGLTVPGLECLCTLVACQQFVCISE